MRNPIYAICEQQRRRSACASAQSDHAFVVRCLNSRIPLLAIAEISRLQLVSVAEQVGLSLSWSQTPKTGFHVMWLIRLVGSTCEFVFYVSRLFERVIPIVP